MTRTTDLRGVPMTHAMSTISHAVAQLTGGQSVAILSSDPESVLDVMAWTHATGNPLVDLRQVEGAYRFVIQRRG